MRVVTMGEMMIRFMPKNNLRFEQATEFEAHYGGDESIVAVSLARFGMDARYITKLPLNPLGQTALGKLREQGAIVTVMPMAKNMKHQIGLLEAEGYVKFEKIYE